jgi:hypothetical protein
MHKILLFVTLFFVASLPVLSQVGIGVATPHNSAQLELSSNTRGFLPTRMTTVERNNIVSPATGLQIFNTTTNCLEFFVNGVWQPIACGCSSAPSSVPAAGNHVATSSQIVWSWNVVSGASGYKYSTVNSYGTATDNFNNNSLTQSGLVCNGSPQTLYVWAYNACGNSTPVTLTKNLEFPVAVSVVGTGSGIVTSNPTGISCSPTCNATYSCGTQVNLTANANTGSHFIGWSGACSGTGSCNLTVNSAQNVTANFSLNSYPLTVSKTGNGAGMVTSSPAGINCGTTCTANYNHGTMVTLTATPANGSTFTGWSGGCSGTGSCVTTMTSAQTVSANFNINNYTLTVVKSGTGSGTVISSPAGINCGTDCSEPYASGTMVTLTATASSGSNFVGWSGACSGTGSCVVTMSAAQTVTATFQ